MKKLFLTLLVLVASVASLSAAGISWVVVTSASGEVTEFALADQPKVTFANGEVVITAGDQTLSLPTKEKVTFTFAEVSGIDEALIQAVNPTFYWDNNTLQAAGLKANEVVYLYNTNGMLLNSVRADNDGVATLSLEQFNGILIISTQSKSLKIRK